MNEPDSKFVKVQFKVTEPNTSDRIVTNYAEIADDEDEDGNKVDDKDSTPNKWIEGEDDQDIENIKVKYFDLSLSKWVTKSVIEENGNVVKTTIMDNAEKTDKILKVDVSKRELKDATVKFEYKIKVVNEGEIAGYAKEVKDYIPDGLKFDVNDNPNWKLQSDGSIITTEFENTLLQPGESAETTVILTWINGDDNLGIKTNIAEISKDFNESNTPDIDSTPNNKVMTEDDIDTAMVMLTTKTGSEIIAYVGVALGFISIIGIGAYTIRKKVM